MAVKTVYYCQNLGTEKTSPWKSFYSKTIACLKLSTFTKHLGVRLVVSFTGEPIRIVRRLAETVKLSLYPPHSHNKYGTQGSCLTEFLMMIQVTSSHLVFDKIAWLKPHNFFGIKDFALDDVRIKPWMSWLPLLDNF